MTYEIYHISDITDHVSLTSILLPVFEQTQILNVDRTIACSLVLFLLLPEEVESSFRRPYQDIFDTDNNSIYTKRFDVSNHSY